MVDIVSLQKSGSVLDPSAKYKHVIRTHFPSPKNIPMSIFDFQVHLCTDGNPPNMLPHNCKTHTFLSLNQAFTRAGPPLGISLFRSCRGPLCDPNERNFNVHGKVKLFLLGRWFCSRRFLLLYSIFFFFFVSENLSFCAHTVLPWY